MTIPTIGNWGEELGQAASNFGQSIGGLLNPNLELQKQLKLLMAKDPTLRQKLIDMEAANPGSLAQQFGKQAAVLGQGTISPEMEMQIAQRGLANKSVKDVTNTDTVAAQQFLNRADIGDAQKQAMNQLNKKHLEGTIAFNEVGRKQKELELKEAQTKWEALKDSLPIEYQAAQQANIAKLQREVQDHQVAADALKSYGEDLPAVIHNIALLQTGGKYDKTKVMPYSMQNALSNVNKGFAQDLETEVRRLMSDREYQQRLTLVNMDKADRKEMLAQQQANQYMQVARQAGISVDPVAMYDVFLKGFDASAKNPKYKSTLDIIGKLDKTSGAVNTAQLYNALGASLNRALTLTELVKKNGRGAVSPDALRAAVESYDMNREAFIDRLKMTGQEDKISTVPTLEIDPGVAKFFGFVSPKPSIKMKQEASGGKVDNQSKIDDLAQAANAGNWTDAQIDALPETIEVKNAIKLKRKNPVNASTKP